MTQQARIQSSVNIQSGTLQYQNFPTAATVPVVGTNGPTPGALLIPVGAGADVNLSELTSMGGICVFTNLDTTNYVTVGVRDTVTNVFYPLFDILAGDWSPAIRLSKHLGLDYHGTGTGAGTTALHMKAYGGSVRVKVEAFDP